MVLLGYLLAVAMGLTLGGIGAGGSILTVPILVYLLGVKPVVATGYSLLVVGSAALMGAVHYWQHKLVNIRAALLFSAPAMLTVLIARTFIVPSIPDPVGGIAKDVLIMFLFSGLMIIAAVHMLRPRQVHSPEAADLNLAHLLKLVSGSAGIGLLTGMAGAGGGFLIVPTLITLFRLHIKEAVGTSLAIIAMNSLVGFNGDIATGIPIDWSLLGTFLGLTLLGMWLGTRLSKRMEGKKLRWLFGTFTLLVGLMILVQELYILWS